MSGLLKLMPVLFLALFIFSASGQFIASINCGASDVVHDLNLITWTPDNTLISNGDARKVPSINSLSTVLDTLRVFTSRKKNCYSIPVTQGDKVLVRASFNYGNYDGLSNPPTFDLHFDGNFWAMVKTTIRGVVMSEITYVAKGDVISVCVAQTRPGQFPFISALEVRRLDSKIYRELDNNRALLLSSRVSFGATENLRYPYDTYDRIWGYPAALLDTVVRNDLSSVDTTKAPNNPPSEVFQTAITTDNSSEFGILLATVTPDNPIYANMYFSEVSSLSFSKRVSRIYYLGPRSDTDRWLTLPFSPPYGSVLVQYLYNYTVNTTRQIYMCRTQDYYLQPLINAMELFQISEVLTDGTNSNDVIALSLLQSKFDVLRGWSGDPCLPAPYSWDWLNCSNDATPRVISL
ncbi:Malectin-like carbohydrate-binding domain-containing protein [Artemisia annua]|uniref:Malectin-like carbohydrate-binding domain-containing protein n=1 Tax=Artemisia annua TaxID=35608 RepID=A0A2U1LEW9_ARTAN|nr:Malectin-like carbohydrate-binding domain-containing protein [Artemisia annua]